MDTLKHIPTHADQLVSATGYSAFDTQTLTKREYFAALALQGILANPETGHYTTDSITSSAVQFADGLIAQLNK